MKRRVRILPLIILLIAAAAPSALAGSGNGSLSGTVMSADGKALFGAIVALFKQNDRGAILSLTQSDEKGSYSLSDIVPGSYSMRVTRYGYQVISAARVSIDPGKTTTLNFVLQEFLDFLSARDDPRNWNLKTVIRSTSDRRLIFRGLPGSTPIEGQGSAFQRSGTVNIASNAMLGGDSYTVYPNIADAGITSNFAYSEPVSTHTRMIFSGQLTSGYDSLWRVRNTFHYRPDAGRDYKVSVGYGRLNLNRLNAGPVARPVELFNDSSGLRDSGVETLALGFQASNELFRTLALEYGFDLSRINYGSTRNIWSPYFQVVVTPASGWMIRTLMTSRRSSDDSYIGLPDGDMVNLMEPATIAKVHGNVSISQVRHSELAMGKKLGESSSVELTVYRERVDGTGPPFLMTFNTRRGHRTCASQLRSDQDGQQGVRLEFARMLSDTVRGSISYNYGSAATLNEPDGMVTSDFLANNILDMIQHSYYQAITSRVDATIPQTRTEVQATVRWFPGNPISTIDLFSDLTDNFAKGMVVSVRQAIPLPEFMGYYGRWEARIDVRNPFDQGNNRIMTTDGDLSLTRSPRTLRFGLNLNFF